MHFDYFQWSRIDETDDSTDGHGKFDFLVNETSMSPFVRCI